MCHWLRQCFSLSRSYALRGNAPRRRSASSTEEFDSGLHVVLALRTRSVQDGVPTQSAGTRIPTGRTPTQQTLAEPVAHFIRQLLADCGEFEINAGKSGQFLQLCFEQAFLSCRQIAQRCSDGAAVDAEKTHD